jgi:hypothetical protein
MSWFKNTNFNFKGWVLKYKWFLGIGLIGITVMALGFGGTFNSFFNPVGEDPEATDMTFYIQNSANGTRFDNINANGGVNASIFLFAYYITDPENFDSEDMALLTFSDFPLNQSNIENGDIFTPEENTYYIGLANATGYSFYWFVPYLGINLISLRQLPDGVNMNAFSDDGDSEFANTTDISWNVALLNYATIENQNITNSKMGYTSYSDFSLMTTWQDVSDTIVYNVIVIEFNNTDIDEDSVSVSGLYAEKVRVIGNELQLYCSYTISGKYEFKITLNEDQIGIDWNPTSISWKTGQYAESLTTLCSVS